MYIVFLVFGMYFIFRKFYLNFFGYSGGKDIEIFKGKVLYLLVKVSLI